ncbi:MAG: hypothetical protein ABMA26_24865 [Limisphaerales bacterium]
MQVAEIAGEAADELLARLLAERAVEADEQRVRDAERFDGAEFLRQRVEHRRHAVRRDDGVRMAVEGYDDRHALVLAGVGKCLPDDLLVAEMHAVEDTDGHADLARAGAEFGGGGEDGHGGRLKG